MIWKSNTSFFLVSTPEWAHRGSQPMTREPPSSSPKWPRTCQKWPGAAFPPSSSWGSSHLMDPGLCERARFAVPDLGFPVPHRSPWHFFFFYNGSSIPCKKSHAFSCNLLNDSSCSPIWAVPKPYFPFRKISTYITMLPWSIVTAMTLQTHSNSFYSFGFFSPFAL